MKSVIYISTRTIAFGENDLATLVTNASEKNRANDITGCLIFNGMNFLQLLEGETHKVDECMKRIAGDARHTGIVVIRERDTQTRECPEWGMTGRAVALQQDENHKERVREMLQQASEDTRRIFASFSSL